jgi:pilus assembly protein FimV
MVAKRSSRAVALLLVVPSAAFALGLGDIRLLSPLGQPLKARIGLLDATPGALQSLNVHLASQDTFTRYGLAWPQFLSGVHMKVVRRADGREVVEVSSDQPVTDPVVTLIVEANWDRGRLYREYTVLLNPPMYVPHQSQAAAAPITPALTGTAHRAGQIARSEPPAAPAPASPPASPVSDQSAAAAGSPRSLVVRRGETLSGIADRLSGAGVDSGLTQGWMVAIYRANPDAFDHNMNLLRSGAVLRIPDRAAAAAISPAAATSEIRRQYAAWHGAAQQTASAASGPGRLRLVAPPGGAGASGSAASAGASAGEVKALQAQVQGLQTQLAQEHRLLQVKDAQLARMQAQLAGKAAPPPAESPTAASPPAVAAQSPAPSAPPPAASSPPATAVPPPAATAAPHGAAHVSGKPAPAVKPAASPSILGALASYWWELALLGVALIGYLGLRALRSRRQSELDDSLGRLAAAGAAPSPYTRSEPSAADTASMRPITAVKDDAFVVEESGTHERPRIRDSAVPETRHVTTADTTISSETAVHLDQGDPLAEADFHMAYGLYDQAADLIRIAIAREPERRDLKLKLLEVFFVWGNKEQFLQTAHELAASRAEAAPGEWEKIVIMGKQLAPEDPLFEGGAAVSGAAAAGVDLNLAEGQGGFDALDFDIASGQTGQHAQGLDLDIGSALGEGDTAATAESPGTATDRNMALDTHFADNATGSTREMTATLPGADDVEFGTEAEGPTVEQPALRVSEQPTLRQKVESALKQSGGEQTAELAIDDLGLDLGAFETAEHSVQGSDVSPETPTMVAGLDEHSRRIIEQAAGQRAEETSPERTGTTNAWQLDETELEAVLGDGDPQSNGHDNAATSRLAALSESAAIDYDLGAAEPEHGHATNGANGASLDLDVGDHAEGLDLDVGTATVPDTAFTATQKLSADDLALPDLEPVTMSEVGTKLDLARAYMDMGDPEGARNILEEVMHEGSNMQRQEAERLMESLPG